MTPAERSLLLKLAGGVLLVLIIVVAYALKPAPLVPVAPGPTPAPVIATFFCSNDAKLQATFNTDAVDLTLSDGRSFTLPQAVSGSGARYEATTTGVDIVFWNKGDNAFLTEGDTTTYADCTAARVALSDAPGYETYTDQAKSFTFALPTDFSVAGSAVGYSQDWSVNASTSGMVLAHIEMPRSLEPGTNFAGARFTVGTSADPDAVDGCLADTSGAVTGKPTAVTIGGVPFTRIVSSDAGAGNFYETTSYRAVHDGQCYAVEYTIHSMNIGNYPPGAVKEFDKAGVRAALEELVQSFRFLP